MRRTLRNGIGLLADFTIVVFGLVLLARGFTIAAILLLVVGGGDLLLRLGLLPFARRGTFSTRQRGDLLWGVILTLIGAGILGEELIVVVGGSRGGRHMVAIGLGVAALAAGVVFFGRLARSRR